MNRLPVVGPAWRRLDDWMTGPVLARFNCWFTSAAGVLQTGVVVLGIAIVETAHPALDPHGFWLLWALTVYSGITQPALAYAGARAAEMNEELLAKVERLEEEHGRLLAELHAAICEKDAA